MKPMLRPHKFLTLCLVSATLMFSIGTYAQLGFSFSKTKLQRVAYSGIAPSAGVYSVAVNTNTNQKFIGGIFKSLVSSTVPPRHRIARLTASGGFDATFGESSGFEGGSANSHNGDFIKQSTGKIVVYGNSTRHGSSPIGMLVRLNVDGSFDNTFTPGTGPLPLISQAQKLEIQADDSFYICGMLTSYNGSSSNGIARINANGILDTAFAVGTGFTGTPANCKLQTDGKIIVIGPITSYNGTPVNGIVRLNTNGTVDGTFLVGTGFVGGSAQSLAIQPDGKIVVAGTFTSYNSTSLTRIARLNADGSVDGSFVPGSGFNASVSLLKIQTDGKILASGLFATYQGVSANKLIRLESNGNIDNTFSAGTGLDSPAICIELQTDNKILLGGGFTSYNGAAAASLIRISSAGAADASFAIGTGFDGFVYDLELLPDGKIIVTGSFDSYQGLNRQHRLAVYNSSGAMDSTLPTSGNLAASLGSQAIFSSAFQNDGKLVLGGSILQYAGITRRGALRLDTNGGVDSTFISNTTIPINGAVRALVIQADGKIIYSVSNLARKLIRVDSTNSTDSGFDVGTGFDGDVWGLALQSDGKLITVGDFDNFNGSNQVKITRLNPNGSVDLTFAVGTGLNSSGFAVAVQSDGKTIVGGNFTSYNSIPSARIIRLNTDGSVDNTFSIGTGFNGAVRAIVIQPDGKVIVGGDFTSFNGQKRNYLARLNSDGSIDKNFNWGLGFNNSVRSLALHSDGKIVAGGSFTTFEGRQALYFITLAISK